MASRLILQTKLEELLGTKDVYYQSPPSLNMHYPAIVYSLSNLENRFANNSVYAQSYFYELTVMDRDPESRVMKEVSKLPKIRFNRHFKSDNLNHWTFTIYY